MIPSTSLKRFVIAVATVVTVNGAVSSFPFSASSTLAQGSDQTEPKTYTIYLPVSQSGEGPSATDVLTITESIESTNEQAAEDAFNNEQPQTEKATAAAVLAWLVNNTDLYYNGGNVGIGTATPATPLHVARVGNGVTARFMKDNGGSDIRVVNAQDGSSGIGTFSQDDMNWYVKGKPVLHMDAQDIGVKLRTITLTALSSGCYNTGIYGLVANVWWDPGGQGSESTYVDVLSYGNLTLYGTGGQGPQSVNNTIKICVRGGTKGFVDSITLSILPFKPF